MHFSKAVVIQNGQVLRTTITLIRAVHDALIDTQRLMCKYFVAHFDEQEHELEHEIILNKSKQTTV